MSSPTSANHGTSSAQRSRPSTLADVAREAGVVAMTASRAINGSGYVSAEVRKRVMKAAQKLRYRPNVLARQLKGQPLHAVGVMLPDIANPFAAELLAGVRVPLEAKGYTVFITVADREVNRERAGLQSLVDHRVDGLIVATRGTSIGDEAIEELVRQHIPIVTIGRPVPGGKADVISADHYQGAFQLVSHLIETGHRRIGFIGISPADADKLHRHQGYVAALKHAGIKVRKEYTTGPSNAPAFSTQEDGHKGMTSLAALRQPPTAIFARNDFTAIGALRAAHELGLRVPEDVAIAGFDNTPLSGWTTPPLTTVSQPIRQQGSLAAEILLNRIEGNLKGHYKVHLMPCELIVRASTGSAIRDPGRRQSKRP